MHFLRGLYNNDWHACAFVISMHIIKRNEKQLTSP